MYIYQEESTQRAATVSAILFSLATPANDYSPRVTRRELAQLTGYSVATVNLALRELAAHGAWLCTPGAGRSASTYSLMTSTPALVVQANRLVWGGDTTAQEDLEWRLEAAEQEDLDEVVFSR